MKTETFNSSINQIENHLAVIESIIKESQGLAPSGNLELFLSKINETKQKLKSRTFQIAVMAMMKSGKSTFINALLGKGFLPTSNVPETAVAVTVRHSNHVNHKEGILSDTKGVIAKGNEIKNKLIELNKVKRNEDLDSMHLTLTAPLQYLVESNKPLDLILFEVLDTPGFGEAEMARLKSRNIAAVSEDILENIGVVIYLLDYSKLKSAAEYEILKKLKELRVDLLHRLKDRLFFVINKVDQANNNSLTPEATVDYVINMLKNTIPNIERSNILPVSSYDALLARLVLSGSASTGDIADFAKKVFGYKNADKKSLEECKLEAEDLLQSSNLPALENAIIEHIYQNRGRLLLDTLISDIERIVQNFQNTEIQTPLGVVRGLSSGRANFQKQKEKMLELKEDIEMVKKKFEELNNEKSKNDYVLTEKMINDCLAPYIEEELIPEVANIIDSQDTRISSEEEVKKLIDKIEKQIQSSFDQFQGRLENDIISKQLKLIEKFDNKAKELSADFQGKVSKALKIDISPLPFRMPNINVTAIKSNFYDVGELIQKRNETRTDYVQRYVSGGICSSGRHVTDAIQRVVTVLDLDKKLVKSKLKEAVKDLQSSSVHSVRGFLEKVVNERIVKTVSNFTELAESYKKSIQKEIEEISEGGDEYINKRLKQLEDIEVNVKRVMESINGVKGFIKK